MSVPLLRASTPVLVSNASEVAYLKLAKYIHSFTLSTAKLVSEAAKTAVYFRNLSDQTNQGYRCEFLIHLRHKSNDFLHGVRRKLTCSQAETHDHN